MTTRDELERPLRPRWARFVSLILIVLILAGAGAIILAMPLLARVPFSAGDAVFTAGLALLVCWFLYRQATVRAVPDAEGITVRNLIVTRRVTWAQIISVRYGPDRPWGYLDLADGESLAVMALQQADGEHGTAQARRLATLLALHEDESR